MVQIITPLKYLDSKSDGFLKKADSKSDCFLNFWYVICFFFRHYILSQSQKIKVSRKLSFLTLLLCERIRKLFFLKLSFPPYIVCLKNISLQSLMRYKSFDSKNWRVMKKFIQNLKRCKNLNSNFDQFSKIGWKTHTFLVSRFKIGALVKKLFRNQSNFRIFFRICFLNSFLFLPYFSTGHENAKLDLRTL